MNNILPTEKAKKYCLDFMTELDNSPLFNILQQEKGGRMFGVLVCQDGTVYRAFSGLLNGQMQAEGFVPPCFDVEKVKNLLDEADRQIKVADTKTASEISRNCFERLKELYVFNCFDGKTRTLKSVFPTAPAGTGDCCAPRLLSYCYSQGKKPASMAEFYYGNGSLEHKHFYPPCDERCKNLLKHIVGLDILYTDGEIVVVNKPHGLLAIEGRGADKQDCIASRVRNLFEFCIEQPCIHRLDQATSGLMVLGLSERAHNALSADFENHRVYKEYEALVDGKVTTPNGEINLPIRLDTDNRPHQIVDFENGKEALTSYSVLAIKKTKLGYVSRLRLIPHTGRTHQLRVHCASGLGHAIVNDPLYGSAKENNQANPLKLQAKVLEFTHPTTGLKMHFELDSEF